jgi:tetratricopeptide (TPR) repeat protein
MSYASLFCALLQVAGAVDVGPALKEAETLAIREETEAAIATYEKILEQGDAAPGLRYNLGTLYLEQGDVGRAVLHLRAAVREDPADDDARHNLDVALAGRADQLLGVGPGLPWWQALARQVRPGVAQVAFLAPFLLLLLLIAASPWLPVGRWPKALLVVIAVLTIAGGIVLGARMADDRQALAVVLEDTNALKGPDASAATAFEAHAGLSGTVRGEEGAFMRVRLDNGVEAWFERERLGLLK